MLIFNSFYILSVHCANHSGVVWDFLRVCIVVHFSKHFLSFFGLFSYAQLWVSLEIFTEREFPSPPFLPTFLTPFSNYLWPDRWGFLANLTSVQLCLSVQMGLHYGQSNKVTAEGPLPLLQVGVCFPGSHCLGVQIPNWN